MDESTVIILQASERREKPERVLKAIMRYGLGFGLACWVICLLVQSNQQAMMIVAAIGGAGLAAGLLAALILAPGMDRKMIADWEASHPGEKWDDDPYANDVI